MLQLAGALPGAPVLEPGGNLLLGHAKLPCQRRALACSNTRQKQRSAATHWKPSIADMTRSQWRSGYECLLVTGQVTGGPTGGQAGEEKAGG